MRFVLVALLLVTATKEPPKEKKTVELKISVLVDEDSEIYIGKKKVTIDDIPEEGTIADLQIIDNRVKKVIFEEKKK